MTRKPISKIFQLAGSILLLGILPAPDGHSSELLRPDLHSLAEKISSFLEGERQTSIAVGNFSAPPALMASSGAGIKKTLMEELEAVGVTVDRKAALVVKGDYGLSYNEKGPNEGYIFGRVIRAAGGQRGAWCGEG